METIKIGINVKNERYAHNLARVMAKQSDRLDITIISESRYNAYQEMLKQDILISDKDEIYAYDPGYLLLEGNERLTCCEEYREKEQLMSKFEPVTHILRRVIEMYENRSGNRFSQSCENGSFIYQVLSDMGGSGATAVALTMARLFACEHGKKVLYINEGGSECSRWYINDAQSALRSAPELDCMIRNCVEFNIFSYLTKDEYGVYVLERSGRQQNSDALIEKLCEEKIFDIIIADMQCCKSRLLFYRSFFVRSEKDGRSRIRREYGEASADEGEAIWEIRNRSTYNHRIGKVIHIADDAASFVPSKAGIEIALDRDFASGVRRLLSL